MTDQNGEPVNRMVILECLEVSLKVLLALLSWNEIKGSDQKELRLVSIMVTFNYVAELDCVPLLFSFL